MSQEKNYFEAPDEIFYNKNLLQISHTPNENRIIGRDDQLSSLATALRPATKNQEPNNAFIYGKPGTGKSMCAKFLAQQLVDTAAKNDVNVGFAYVDCLQDSSETQVIQTIGSSINDRAVTDTYFPPSGIGTSLLYDRLWQVLDELYDVAIIILDELDKLDAPNEVLMQLPRAGEAEKITNCSLSVVGISNKAKFKQELEARVTSSLCDREFVFPPYDASQLKEILYARRDAFQDDALEDGVIELAAAYAGQEYGDARQAIDILRFAGEIAEEEEATEVTTDHVEQAHQEAEKNKLLELMQSLTPQSTRVLRALALRDKEGPTDTPVTSTDVYSAYVALSKKEGSTVLSQRRVRDLLSELKFLEIIEKRRKGAGRGEGTYTENHLLDDPEIVIEACNEAESRRAALSEERVEEQSDSE